MSHVVQIQTEIRDPVAIQAACGRLSLPEPVFGETQLFSSSAVGWAVRLPEWRYPVVCDVATAKIAVDNFDGRWGDPKELDKFRQRCSVEKARIEARRQGHTVSEEQLADGSIRVRISGLWVTTVEPDEAEREFVEHASRRQWTLTIRMDGQSQAAIQRFSNATPKPGSITDLSQSEEEPKS